MARSSLDGSGQDLSGARLMVAEDEVLIAFELQSMLTEAGADVVGCAHTLTAALVLAEELDLSAAVLDFRLGDQDVLPLARRLAARRVPFVIYTGQIRTGTIKTEWPACQIVSKPALPRTLIKAVAGVLGRGGAH